MYQPPEFIYRQHSWRRPARDSETWFVLSQLPREGFTVKNFIELFQSHLAFQGRKAQRKDSIRAKLKYYWQMGYVVRRRVWQGEECWVELSAMGQEMREVEREFGEIPPSEIPRLLPQETEPSEEELAEARRQLEEHARKKKQEEEVYTQRQLKSAERMLTSDLVPEEARLSDHDEVIAELYSK
jgi:hypothetical protein